MLFRSMFDEQPDSRSQRQSRTLCSAVPGLPYKLVNEAGEDLLSGKDAAISLES